MNRKLLQCSLVLVWAFAGFVKADIVLVNGSFEAENAFTANYRFSNLNSFNPANIDPNAITGWHVSSVQTTTASWINIQDGNIDFVLNRAGARYGLLTSDISMVTRGADRPLIDGGQSLRLDFLLSNDVSVAGASVTIGLDFFADTIQSSAPISSTSQVFLLPAASSPRQLAAFNIIASTPSNASFLGVSVRTFPPLQGINHVLFDNFRITSVPEPSAMVLVSIVLVSILIGKGIWGWNVNSAKRILPNQS